MTTVNLEQFEKVIGKPISVAMKEFPKYIFRVKKEDGFSRIVTMELRSNRVNVEVTNKLITKIVGIG